VTDHLPNRPIAFSRPWLAGREYDYVRQSLDSGELSGDRGFTRRCQTFLEQRLGARRVLLTTSCTSALEMAALLLYVAPGDEVILPSYTFVSTANAFHLRGATLRFVDIRPDTMNMDADRVAEAIGPRTRAIVPVHYAGVGCDMDQIFALARPHGIAVVEDAAQAVDATYRGRALGTLGDLGTFSFHDTKNFVCGEGGALLVNRDDLIDRAEITREKGTDRSRFLRGQVDKYTWVDKGSSYVPSDLLAALLLAQLESIDEITARRQRVYDAYHDAFAPLEEAGVLRRPVIPEGCRCNFHMYFIVLPDLDTRTRLIDWLKARGITAVFHYVPLHTSPVGLSLGWRHGTLPVTESVAERLLRLPMHAGLTDDDVGRVIESVHAFFG
jgi:dTDP-4-amino-4,6-dideoxygalactose transaminase